MIPWEFVKCSILYFYSPGITSLSLLFAFKHATETLGLFLMCIFPFFFYFATKRLGLLFTENVGAVFHLLIADANAAVHQTDQLFVSLPALMTNCMFSVMMNG